MSARRTHISHARFRTYSLPVMLLEKPSTAIALAGLASSPLTMIVERQITKVMTKAFIVLLLLLLSDE
jgi:hypothetical protein